MNQNLSQPPLTIRLAAKLIIAAMGIALLVYAREILIPFTIAIFFTFLLLPVSNFLIKHKFPKIPAILLSLVLAIVVFGGLIYFFYSQIMLFRDDLPQLRETVSSKVQQLQNFLRDEFNISETKQEEWIMNKAKETAASDESVIVSFFAFTGTFIANMALIPIYIFFLTLFKEKYQAFILMVSPTREHENILAIIAQIATVSQKYLKGILIDVAILSVLNSTGFLIIGIKHAILFGVLASILNIIPYIGVLIGSLLPVAMALLTMDSIGYAFAAAGVCIVVQFIDNNIINPYVVGSSVSINPLTATLALVTGALIWGIAGMILSIPVMGMIKVICDNVPKLKPYGFLIGEERDYEHEDHYAERFLKSLRRKKVA